MTLKEAAKKIISEMVEKGIKFVYVVPTGKSLNVKIARHAEFVRFEIESAPDVADKQSFVALFNLEGSLFAEPKEKKHLSAFLLPLFNSLFVKEEISSCFGMEEIPTATSFVPPQI